MLPSVQPYPCHANVDIKCSKVWVPGHEEVLGVSWTGPNPTSHTALMTLCLVGSERKRRGTGPSVREQPFTLCSVPLLCQEEDGIGRKRNQTKLPGQLHSDSGLPVRHRGLQRNIPNTITSTLHHNKFSSACPSLSFYSKGDKKLSSRLL